MYTLRLTHLEDVEGAVKYEIICDGQVTITQEFDPDREWFHYMAEDRAREVGEIVLDRVISGDVKELEKIQAQIDNLDRSRQDSQHIESFLQSNKTNYIDRLFPEDVENGEGIDTERLQTYIDQVQEQLGSEHIKDTSREFLKKLLKTLEAKL